MQNDYTKYSIGAILAGAVIGVGGIAYLAIPNHIIGSLLFSFGLLTIIANKYYLYTGMIGDYTPSETLKYFNILLCNMFGAGIMGFVANLMGYNTDTLVLAKMSKSYIELFVSSILCGILMYIGVNTTKRKNSTIYAIMAVMIFILTGAEHCVANAFYFALIPVSFDIVLFFIVNILGNSLGAILWKQLENLK